MTGKHHLSSYIDDDLYLYLQIIASTAANVKKIFEKQQPLRLESLVHYKVIRRRAYASLIKNWWTKYNATR